MSVGLKHLYSGKEDRKGRFQWQTTIPEDVGKPAEDAETQKWALIVRHIKVYNDPSKVLAIHSIVIQSPLLKELLKGVVMILGKSASTLILVIVCGSHANDFSYRQIP